MNIWKRLRHKIDIPTNEIANLLHIPEKKYIEIESGVRQMPKNLINNFMKIYHERKEIKGETQIKMIDVNQFLQTMDLKELKKEFNYKSNKELAKAIGIGQCQIYKLKDVDTLSDNTKMKVYNFFNNPLNINCEDKTQTKTKIKIKTNRVENHTKEQGQELINSLLNNKKMTSKEISTAIDVHNSTISNWSRGVYGMSDKNYEKLRKLANEIADINTNNDIENSIQPLENNDSFDIQPLENNKENSDEYNTLLKLLDELTNENIMLKTQVMRYEKLIDRM